MDGVCCASLWSIRIYTYRWKLWACDLYLQRRERSRPAAAACCPHKERGTHVFPRPALRLQNTGLGVRVRGPSWPHSAAACTRADSLVISIAPTPHVVALRHVNVFSQQTDGWGRPASSGRRAAVQARHGRSTHGDFPVALEQRHQVLCDQASLEKRSLFVHMSTIDKEVVPLGKDARQVDETDVVLSRDAA